MANEFRIKNGFFSEGNSNITGSLNVSVTASAAVFTGSFSGDGSQLINLPVASIDTGSLVTTASFTAYTSSNTSQFAGTAATASYIDIAALPLIQPVTEYQTLTASITSAATHTLPNGLTYISSSVYEYIEVFANQQRLRYNIDFIPVSDTSIQFNFTIPSGSEMSYKVFRRP
jgi:hypothetical protein